VPRIPEIKQALKLTDGQLGLVLISSSIGAVIGAQSAGHLVQRFGSKRLIGYLQFLMPFGLVVMGFAENVQTLVLGLFLMGLGYAGIDISVNAQAVVAESLLKERFLASLHGFWSIGAFTAALIGGFLAAHSTPKLNLVSVAVIGSALFVILNRNLLGKEYDQTGHEDGSKSNHLPWFSRSVLVLWTMAVGSTGSFIAEGAASDWGGVLLVEHIGTSPAVSASVFASFSVAMIISRFSADKILHKFGLAKTIKIAGIFGGLIWACGILIGAEISASNKWLAVVIVNLGFFAAGLAVGPMFPAFILGASQINGVAPSLAIARIGVIAIAGYFVGPTITGFISELTSLPTALMYPALMLVLSGFMSRSLRS
jgi:MFS family permease